MAVLRFDIQGNPKAIPFKTFLDTANRSLSIVKDLDYRFSSRADGAVEWFTNNLGMNGTLTFEIESHVRLMKRKKLEDVGAQVANSFVAGFDQLERTGHTPAYLTDDGMQKAQKLTGILGTEMARAIVASVPGESEVTITKASATYLNELLPIAGTSFGSVEGLLQAISIRNGSRFIVYQTSTDKAVTCVISGLSLVDKAKDSLGKRVLVSGIVSRNARAEPQRVTLMSESDFKVFDDDNFKVLPFRNLGGSDPDLTGGLSTEEFIRDIRG